MKEQDDRWHREIDQIVNEMQSNIDQMDAMHCFVITSQEIKSTMK